MGELKGGHAGDEHLAIGVNDRLAARHVIEIIGRVAVGEDVNRLIVRTALVAESGQIEEAVFSWTKGCRGLAAFFLRWLANGKGDTFSLDENDCPLVRPLTDAMRRARQPKADDKPKAANFVRRIFLQPEGNVVQPKGNVVQRQENPNLIDSLFKPHYAPVRRAADLCRVQPRTGREKWNITVSYKERNVVARDRFAEFARAIGSPRPQDEEKDVLGTGVRASVEAAVETGKPGAVSEMKLADAATPAGQSPSAAPTEEKPETASLTAESIRSWMSDSSYKPLRENPRAFLDLPDQAKEVIVYHGLNRLYHKDFPHAEPRAYPPPSFLAADGDIYDVLESAWEELRAARTGLRSKINQTNEDLV